MTVVLAPNLLNSTQDLKGENTENSLRKKYVGVLILHHNYLIVLYIELQNIIWELSSPLHKAMYQFIVSVMDSHLGCRQK